MAAQGEPDFVHLQCQVAELVQKVRQQQLRNKIQALLRAIPALAFFSDHWQPLVMRANQGMLDLVVLQTTNLGSLAMDPAGTHL